MPPVTPVPPVGASCPPPASACVPSPQSPSPTNWHTCRPSFAATSWLTPVATKPATTAATNTIRPTCSSVDWPRSRRQVSRCGSENGGSSSRSRSGSRNHSRLSGRVRNHSTSTGRNSSVKPCT
ncbi:hypothetical protein BJP40_22585 [Streptomyces sp. CC53]|nr:hypothetical protein BJP40_22585 [Streptomyces sp. CC53]